MQKKVNKLRNAKIIIFNFYIKEVSVQIKMKYAYLSASNWLLS